MAARFNHMELSYPRGELTSSLKAEISEQYQHLFGWQSMEVDILKQKALLLMVDEEVSQFILLAEADKPMSSPGFDHLGILMDSRTDVDALLAKCKQLQASDSRLQIKEYKDLQQGGTTIHAFYVKYLLPIYFDVQSIEYSPGSEPAKQWVYR